ncbi:MAG: hypothetical protein K0S58_2473 [Nitrospira sp.]|nr:hypothetical protein [Nitrospira sp.]
MRQDMMEDEYSREMEESKPSNANQPPWTSGNRMLISISLRHLSLDGKAGCGNDACYAAPRNMFIVHVTPKRLSFTSSPRP